jgi:predicted ATPase/transcriptional regulator with XRE-family HTH domain
MTTAQDPTFGELVRHYRRVARLTQEELADRAGLSRRGITALETGERQIPQRRTVELLADALQLSPQDRASFLTAARLRTAATTRVLRPADRRCNLPYPLTSFVGRDREMAAIKRCLMASRLVTLTGPAGMGKTRLALEVAGTQVATYRDGVWLVELAAVRDDFLLPQVVAATLGVREEPGVSLRTSLIRGLETKDLLLVLDNCEHLVGACADIVQTLLQHCPTLTILATSRERLHVPGEVTWQVPPLALPQSGVGGSWAEVLRSEAVQLFLARAQLAQSAFQLMEQNPDDVVQVCVRLDGLPLALELAAARVRVLTVGQISARLSDRFRLLSAGSRVDDERQSTLRAAIDWSYALLTDRERLLLRRLSTFVGGWTLEAAEAVCARAGIEKGEVLDLLMGLVDKSLVRVDQDSEATRFSFLESIQAYARERLRTSGEGETVRQRHASYYLQLAEQAAPGLRGENQGRWLDRLQAELDNLRAAVDCWRDGNETERVLQFAGAIWRFWDMRGYVSEGRRWLDEALDGTTADSTVRVTALIAAGALAQIQSDYAAAAHWYTEALALSRDRGDRHGIARCLNNLGLLASYQDDYVRATDLLQESLVLNRELSRTWGIASSLLNLGEVARLQGDHGRAMRFYHESLALFRGMGDTWSIGVTLNNLGLVTTVQGDYERATSFHRESLCLFRAIGDHGGIAESLDGLGLLARIEGRLDRAARLWGAADALREPRGAPLQPAERQRQEHEVEIVRAQLGEPAWTTAWAEGRAMSLEQVMAYALRDNQ